MTPQSTPRSPHARRTVVRPGILPAPGARQWVPACPVTSLVPGRGVAVLLPGGAQAALFLLPNGMIYAVDNLDPYARRRGHLARPHRRPCRRADRGLTAAQAGLLAAHGRRPRRSRSRPADVCRPRPARRRADRPPPPLTVERPRSGPLAHVERPRTGARFVAFRRVERGQEVRRSGGGDEGGAEGRLEVGRRAADEARQVAAVGEQSPVRRCHGRRRRARRHTPRGGPPRRGPRCSRGRTGRGRRPRGRRRGSARRLLSQREGVVAAELVDLALVALRPRARQRPRRRSRRASRR